MPHLVETIDLGKPAVGLTATLHTKYFTPEQLAQAVRVQVWGSSFSDPGDDWCEYRLFNQAGEQIATSGQIPGY